MQKRKRIPEIIPAVWLIILLILTVSQAFAELKIESVYPTLGKMGEDLAVTLKGSGFDENTRVSMYLDAGNSKAIIGSVDTPGITYSLSVIGTTAYVADGEKGLQVIDISNLASPKIIGAVDTPGLANAITVTGIMAYIADETSLQIIDISNPVAPKIIGSVGTLRSACDVTVIDTIAYVADATIGLQIIDISNPAVPKLIGSLDGYAEGVAVIGDMAYVADWDNGLQVIDISNLSNPKIIGSVDTPGYATSVEIIKNTAFVTTHNNDSLQVIDISNPTFPRIIGSVDTPSVAHNVMIIDRLAYVANELSGLQVIDISSLASPKIIGSVNTPGFSLDVLIIGNIAYVADEFDGLKVIDISDLDDLNYIKNVDTPGTAYSVTVIDNMAYVADNDRGLQMIDITNPDTPKIVNSVDTPGSANDVTVIGGIAYVADGSSGLQVIDISNFSSPKIIGSVDTPGIANSVTIIKNKAYVADAFKGLQVIDISNPVSPKIIGSVDTPGQALSVVIIDSIAYVADGDNGLQVIDISNTSVLKIIGSVDTPGYARDLSVIGSTAYLADGNSGLQIIDISNPLIPVNIGSVEMPGEAKGIAVVDTIAFVADWGIGLQMIDVSNPVDPIIISTINSFELACNLLVIGTTAYIVDWNYGLSIIPLPVEIKSVSAINTETVIAPLPSPQIPGNYTLRVFNNKDELYESSGAVTFAESVLTSKAIIAAGGGPYPINDLWEATKICTDFAYLALMAQGYTRENIFFLSPETGTDIDGDGLPNDIDREADTDNLSYAVNDWAKDASELLIYMTGHGGDGTFELNGTTTTTQILSAETLDGWLDTFQTTADGKVILIYDACQSGSFLSKLTPPDGKERIVITSAKSDERAWFMENGVLSFSYQFWSSVFLNAKLYKSFITGKNMMESDQSSLLDADGNAEGNEKADFALADDIIIGRGRVAASIPPIINTISEKQTLNGETTATIKAGGIVALNPITRVWAVITPPDYNAGSPDRPVTNLPAVELQGPDASSEYKGNYNDFTLTGTYKITVFAKDSEGTYSLPIRTEIEQIKGTSWEKGDISGDNTVDLKDAVIALKVLTGMDASVLSNYAASGADVNKNSTVGMEEVIFILQKIGISGK